jgi:hypothetical protein
MQTRIDSDWDHWSTLMANLWLPGPDLGCIRGLLSESVEVLFNSCVANRDVFTFLFVHWCNNLSSVALMHALCVLFAKRPVSRVDICIPFHSFCIKSQKCMSKLIWSAYLYRIFFASVLCSTLTKCPFFDVPSYAIHIRGRYVRKRSFNSVFES